MPGEPQPLVDNQKIVTEAGTPTQYFIRWAQQRQIDIAAGITAAEAEQLITDFLAEHQLQAGTGISITPSGSIADDPTIALNAVIGNLNDVDVLTTPPTNGQVLVYDDVDMVWKPADQSGGGGGGGALTRIAQVVLSADAPDITFASVPQNFDDLVIVVNTQSPLQGAATNLRMRFNGDTGANYSWRWNASYGTGAATSGSTFIDVGDIPPEATAGASQGLRTAAIEVFNYTDTALQKQIASQGGIRFVTSLTYGPDGSGINTSGQWDNTAAITDIQLYSSAADLKAGTVITLYGRGGSGGGGGGGASAASVVQSVYARVSGGGTQNVTLAGAPTPGNLLLAIWNGSGGDGGGDPPAGFAIVGFNVTQDGIRNYNSNTRPGGVGNLYQGCWVAVRRVQAGDSATTTFNRGNDVNNLGLVEITDADIFDFKPAALQMLAGDNFEVLRQRPAHPALCLLVIESDGNDAPVMAGTGWTLLNTWSGGSNHAAALWAVDDATGQLLGAFAGASHPFPVSWQINVAKYSGS
jgi:hypothetical protein